MYCFYEQVLELYIIYNVEVKVNRCFEFLFAIFQITLKYKVNTQAKMSILYNLKTFTPNIYDTSFVFTPKKYY